MPEAFPVTDPYENIRAEQSYEATMVRERGMRKFKSKEQARHFVSAHAAVQNPFDLGRQLVRARHHRDFRMGVFGEWEAAVA